MSLKTGIWRHILLLAGTLLLGACSKEIPVDTDQPSPKDYIAPTVANINIETENGCDISSTTAYVNCTFRLNGNGFFDNLSAPAQVRGRGNSTWYWYPKKPYKIKLEEKAKVMGMHKARKWCLLADFRDPTHMMNMVAYAAAEYMQMPFAPHVRYATVSVNGTNMGLYAVTEQIERHKGRVEIDSLQGYLLSMDDNDGPASAPHAGDNFWSKAYGSAMCVKYPEDPTPEQVSAAQSAYARVENAVKSLDWDTIQSVIDVQTWVDFLLIQEITQNVDFNWYAGSHSTYMYRSTVSDKWYLGPVWDFDSGFGYDGWDVYNTQGYCQTFFANTTDMIMGTDPYRHIGAFRTSAPYIFADLFGVPQFTRAYVSRWNELKKPLLAYLLSCIDDVDAKIRNYAVADYSRWGISAHFTYNEEVSKLKQWLTDRFSAIDPVINAYPYL